MEQQSADLDGLAAAVRMAGGVRAVAARAKIDPGNLSRYLRGCGGLAAERAAALWSSLGRPQGQPDTRVLVLRATGANEVLARALRWHLPGGGQVAWAAWTAITCERLEAVFGRVYLPGIHAATDGRARLLLMLPAGMTLPRELFPSRCPDLLWADGNPDTAVLNLTDPVPWVSGTVSVDEFTAAWPGQGYEPSAEDVVEEIRRLRLGFAEAIRRLHRGSQPATSIRGSA